jgi:hypothetical protein
MAFSVLMEVALPNGILGFDGGRVAEWHLQFVVAELEGELDESVVDHSVCGWLLKTGVTQRAQ